jgi:hypothetical protein
MEARTAIDPAAVAAVQAAALPVDYLHALVETFHALAESTRACILYALMQQSTVVSPMIVVVVGKLPRSPQVGPLFAC